MFFGKASVKVIDSASVVVSGVLKADPIDLDPEVRAVIALRAPCPVKGCTWSLVNVLDPDFTGFSSKHLSEHDPAQHLSYPNLVVVRDLGLVAKLAYESSPVISYIAKSWGLVSEAKYHFNFGDTQAFIAYDDYNILVSFRGTETINPRDWATDVAVTLKSFLPRNLGGASVFDPPATKPLGHSGFMGALGLYSTGEVVTAFGHIHDVLADLLSEKHRKIWVTGHSLGAALASVFVGQLLVENGELARNISGLYTYGQPRSGDVPYCKLFVDLEVSGKVWRIVNKNDIVPRVPTKGLGYFHHGRLAFISDKNEMEVSQDLFTDPTPNIDNIVTEKTAQTKSILTGDKKILLSSDMKTIVSVLCPYFLQDHFPMEYIRNVEKIMAKSDN